MDEPITCHPLHEKPGNDCFSAKDEFLRFIKDPRTYRDEYSRIDSIAQNIRHERVLGDTIFHMLAWLCFREREKLEVLRMLIQNTQDSECVREAFLDYADKGELNRVTALFLAAPELFLSSPSCGLSTVSKLYHELSSLESKTNFEQELSLLLDVLLMVGEKLVAYVRLEGIGERSFCRTQIDIAFLLREVVHKKLGVSSPDYYFRFFKEFERPEDSLYDAAFHHYFIDAIDEDDGVVLTWEDVGILFEKETDMFTLLPRLLKRENIDQVYFYSVLPDLKPVDAGSLNRAIEMKLSSMSTVNICREDMTKKLYEGVRPLPQSRCERSFERDVQTFHSCAASAKPKIDLKIIPRNCWENKVMKPNKYFFSAMDLSYFLTIVKRRMSWMPYC